MQEEKRGEDCDRDERPHDADLAQRRPELIASGDDRGEGNVGSLLSELFPPFAVRAATLRIARNRTWYRSTSALISCDRDESEPRE